MVDPTPRPTPRTDAMIGAARRILELLDAGPADESMKQEMRTLHFSTQPAWMIAWNRFPIPNMDYPSRIWRGRLREDASTILAMLESGILTEQLDPATGDERALAKEPSKRTAKISVIKRFGLFLSSRSMWEDVAGALIATAILGLLALLATRAF